MPNTKQAKKRLRQNVVRNQRNKSALTRMRHSLRKFRSACEEKNLDEAKNLQKATTILLDKCAAKGVIHRNKAARLKSRMAHLLVTTQAA